MIHETKKSDWKLFRERLPEWQENYMRKMAKKYIVILSRKDKNPSENFWELDEQLKADKRKKGVRLELRKQNVPYDIANLIQDGAITMGDLEGFSDELIERVQILLRM